MHNTKTPTALIWTACFLLPSAPLFGGEKFKDLDEYATISNASSKGFVVANVPSISRMSLDQTLCGTDESLTNIYLLLEKEDYSQAEVCLTRKIIRNPANIKDWQAHRLRATARLHEENYTGVIEDTNIALTINRRDAPMLNALTIALIHIGKPREALLISHETIDLEPKNAEAYVIRAEAWQALGRLREELIELALAAQFDPEHYQNVYKAALNRYGQD